ncbi:MAG: hypothetical protein ACRDD8_11230 [Bacteroidales bacterium]
MEKVKSIQFELSLKGRGIVNFDDNSKASTMTRYKNKVNFNDYKTRNDSGAIVDKANIKIAKKVYSEDDYKVKISSSCLRKGIFTDEMEYITPEISYSKNVLSATIGTRAMIMRGYMFVGEGTSYSVKRKSALNISDAIQTNDALVSVDTCTATGARNNTSLFSIENVGDITYKANGTISIKQLQFISTDPRYDRLAVPNDWADNDESVYRQSLKANFETFNPKVGYFLNKKSVNKLGRYAESGMVLNEEAIVEMVKEILVKLRTLSIERTTAYATADSLRIKLIRDVINDSICGTWIEINSMDDINNLDLSFEDFYEEVPEAEVCKVRAEIDGGMANSEKSKKDKKDKKPKAKKEVAEPVDVATEEETN